MIASPLKWGEIATWYAGLAKGRYALTPEIEKALVADGGEREDARRFHCAPFTAGSRRTTATSRFRSASRASSRTPPAEVFANSYGDCKDKATFFVALMKTHGSHRVPGAAEQLRRRDSHAAQRTSVRSHDRGGGPRGAGAPTSISRRTSFRTARSRRRSRASSDSSCTPTARARRSPFRPIRTAGNKSEIHLVGSLTPDGLFAGKWTHLRIRRAAVLAPRLDVEVDEAGLHRARSHHARDRERDLRGIGWRQPAALRWTRSGCRAEGSRY